MSYTGEPIDRVEDAPFLCGTAQYLADLVSARGADCLHAAFLRSPVASAQIVRVDGSALRSRRGIHAIMTGRDVSRYLRPILEQRNPLGSRFQTAFRVSAPSITVDCMAVDRVRYVGEPVAVVVADDRYQAEDALRDIVFDYREEPAVVDPERATEADAQLVHSTAPRNIAVQMSFEKGHFPATARTAECVVVEHTYRIGRQTPLPLECRGVLARPVEDGMEIWSSTQGPFLVRNVVCAATGWPVDAVRVRAPAIGGAFGQKANVYGEEVVVPLVAKLLDRQVAWVEDRYENLVSASQGRDQIHRTRLIVDRTGAIVSWEDDFLVDFGVYNFSRFGVVGNTAIHLLGPYKIPAVRISGVGVYTNKAPTSQYRGAGRPEATFALERSLDDAARRLGISGFKLRDINMLGPEDLPYGHSLPYRDGSEIVYDGRDYRAVLEAARGLIPDDEFEALKRSHQQGNVRVGLGLAAHMEATARGPEAETVRVTLGSDGGLVVRTGIGVSGQSHQTVFAQIVADAAKIDINRVRVVAGDTQGVPQSLASIASRSAVVAGSAALAGVIQLVAQLRDAIRATLHSGSVRLVAGGFEVDGSRLLTWEELGRWVQHGGRLAGSGCESAVGSFTPAAPTWLMAVHVVAVAVDLDTGSVRTLRYGVAHENGRALNPRVFDGQVRGGVAQGIGGALFEKVCYDDNGQPTSANLADYLVPTARDVPEIRLAHLEARSRLNPLGIRGIGESGLIASGAAIASAVDDAVNEDEYFTDVTPITYDYVLSRLLRGTA